MIGVDTNILVRILVPDHPAQTAIALRFLSQRSAEDPAFVSAVVVAELVWVLDRAYGFSAARIYDAVDWLFESANILLEREQLMERALAKAREANAGISDAIIATLALEAGASKTVTFDKPAATRIAGMELLT